MLIFMIDSPGVLMQFLLDTVMHDIRSLLWVLCAFVCFMFHHYLITVE